MGKKTLLILISSLLIFLNSRVHCADMHNTIDPVHTKSSLSITGLQNLSNTSISSVCPGQNIYIIGSGFTSATTAILGGTGLTIVGIPTFSQMEVIIPMTATAGSIKVIDGVFNTTYSSFSINSTPNPNPSVSTISPICAGINGTVNIQNSENGVSYQAFILGTPVSSIYAGNGSFLVLNIPQNMLVPGNNTIDISASNGCQIMLSMHPVISVSPRPGAANQNLNPTQSNGCYGTNFGVINAGAFGAGDSFKWFSSIVGPTSSFNIISSAVAQNLLPGTLTQDTWFRRVIINSFGCKDTSSAVQLTVTPYPSGTGILNTPTNLCTAQNITLSISGINPASTVYNWNIPGGTLVSSSSNTANILFTTSGTKTILITPVNGGCTGGVMNFPISIKPTPDITTTSTPSFGCSLSSISIPITSSGSVFWTATYSGGATSTPGSGTGSINDYALSSGLINYAVTASLAGCSSSQNFPVIINAYPDTTLLFHKASDTLCYNEDLIVKLPVSEAGVVYRFYKWNGSVTLLDISGSTGGAVTITVPYSKFSPGVDTIRYVAVKPGCSVHINGRKLFVHTSYESPLNPLTAPSGTSLCSNGTNSIALKAPFIPIASVSSYQWFYNNNQIINETTNSYLAYSEGDYSVLSKDVLGCEALSPKTTVGYGFLPLISASKQSTLSTDLLCNAAYATYQWYANTPTGFKKIQGANTNTFTAYFDGNYMIGITTGNCFVLSKEYNLSGKLGGSLLKLLSFDEDSSIVLPVIDFHRDANVFPNPVARGATFSVGYIVGSKETDISFTLYNSHGVEIISKKIQSEGYITLDFDVPEVTSGLYKLIIYDGVRIVYKNITIL